MNEINAVNPVSSLNVSPREESAGGNEKGFAAKLGEAVKTVNASQQSADSAMEQVVQGTLGIHEGMLRVQEAVLSLRLLLQVRNKVMAAYTEIMRMQF